MYGFKWMLFQFRVSTVSQVQQAMASYFRLLMALIFSLVTLQRMWRLMWRASCLTVWTLTDWTLHTLMQTTVTPAWTKPGYDGSKLKYLTKWHRAERKRRKNIPKIGKWRMRDNEKKCYWTTEHFFFFFFSRGRSKSWYSPFEWRQTTS